MVRLVEQDDLYNDAFKISLENKITIYDSLYLALASKLNTELITSDEKQREIADTNGIPVVYTP